MPDLDRLVGDHYREARLTDERAEAILAGEPPRATPASVWRLRLAALAASVLALAWVGYGMFSERDLAARVFAEIAMNHKKGLAAEVATDDFAAVGRALDRLDFAISKPGGPAAGLALLGGRYCSIQGRLAAQLKLAAPGGVRTLYVAELTPQLEAIVGETVIHDSVEITVWREGGIFHGLARDPMPAGE
jgi:anti-sigma factor RsiW